MFSLVMEREEKVVLRLSLSTHARIPFSALGHLSTRDLHHLHYIFIQEDDCLFFPISGVCMYASSSKYVLPRLGCFCTRLKNWKWLRWDETHFPDGICIWLLLLPRRMHSPTVITTTKRTDSYFHYDDHNSSYNGPSWRRGGGRRRDLRNAISAAALLSYSFLSRVLAGWLVD